MCKSPYTVPPSPPQTEIFWRSRSPRDSYSSKKRKTKLTKRKNSNVAVCLPCLHSHCVVLDGSFFGVDRGRERDSSLVRSLALPPNSVFSCACEGKQQRRGIVEKEAAAAEQRCFCSGFFFF